MKEKKNTFGTKVHGPIQPIIETIVLIKILWFCPQCKKTNHREGQDYLHIDDNCDHCDSEVYITDKNS